MNLVPGKNRVTYWPCRYPRDSQPLATILAQGPGRRYSDFLDFCYESSKVDNAVFCIPSMPRWQLIQDQSTIN